MASDGFRHPMIEPMECCLPPVLLVEVVGGVAPTHCHHQPDPFHDFVGDCRAAEVIDSARVLGSDEFPVGFPQMYYLCHPFSP